MVYLNMENKEQYKQQQLYPSLQFKKQEIKIKIEL